MIAVQIQESEESIKLPTDSLLLLTFSSETTLMKLDC